MLISLNCYPQPRAQKTRQITIKDGLLTPGVKFTYQDSKGFMWFAFSKGIARYDGYTVKHYDDFLPDSCAINSYKYVKCFFEDSKGRFWIGTLKNGVARLNRKTDTFTYYNHDPFSGKFGGYNTIGCIVEDRQGVVWMGSGRAGVFKYQQDLDTLIGFNPKNAYPLPGADAVYCLLEDRDGIFWVGTGNGLYHFNRTAETFKQVHIIPKLPQHLSTVEHLLEDKHGNIWIGTNWGVYLYSKANNTWKHYQTQNPEKQNDFKGSFVRGLVEVDAGQSHQMWISTATGVWVYDFSADKFDYFKSREQGSDSPLAGGATYLYLDDNNHIWASINGITLIDPRKNPFHYKQMFSYPDSLFGIDAWCFHEDRDGMLWVGTFNDGLYKYDQHLEFLANYKPTVWNLENIHTTNKNRVTLVYEDAYNNLWVGTAGEGINFFDRNTLTFHPVYFATPSGKKEFAWVSKIIEDKYDRMWIATSIGLFINEKPWEMGQVFNPVIHQVLSGTSVNDIFEDNRSRLWITTINQGVYCLLPENRDSLRFKRYFHKNYSRGLFTNRNASKVCQDAEGNIWMLSGTGLLKYDETSDSIALHEPLDKLLQRENGAFKVDDSGNIWLVTFHGLIRYNPKNSAASSLKTFGVSDGLDYTGIVYTLYENRTGHFFIGGSGPDGAGFCKFHPDSIHEDNVHLPEVVLTDFKIRNEPANLDSSISYKKHISLKHNQNFFSFEFAAIEYRDPSKNQHAYMLEGLDDDWNYSGTRRFASYTGVPPGDYVFRVKGSNNDGYWNEEGASIHISIAPPPWLTWWAYSLYTLLIAGLIAAWRRYDLKRQRLKQALEIEHVESEKLKELDKMKSRFFANISHEFRTPLTLILGPLEKLKSKIIDDNYQQDLNVMQRNALRLLKLINQLLNLSKLEADQMKLQTTDENLVQLVKGYVHSFESLAKQKNIALSVFSENDNISAFIDRDKIEKILYNLLSNAFKFTREGGRIMVEVSRQAAVGSQQMAGGSQQSTGSRQWVGITISDTGQGISAEKLPHIFDRFYQADDSYAKDQEGTGIGLALTKELVQLHYGNISVESILDQGTKISVFLPLGKAHLKPGEILPEAKITDKLPDPGADTGSFDLAKEFIEPLKQTKTPSVDFEPFDLEGETKPLILIVEDNADLRAYIRSYLDDDCVVSEAFDGEMGLQKAINKIPDLIVSDVMMPKMDGIKLCHKLKTDERTSHIPVILLTAKAAMEDKLEGLETGADDFITKPFDPQELLIRIKNLIDQRAKLREYFLHTLEPDEKKEEIPQSLDQQFLSKARQILEQKIADPDFGVEEFAGDMALSRVQLHRKLKALVNHSATDFIRLLRLNRAAKLLKSKSGTVTEIAYQVGFNNLSYFAKCFHELFGVNPSEYA